MREGRTVVPAKAGTQGRLHVVFPWIPAFAGMTAGRGGGSAKGRAALPLILRRERSEPRRMFQLSQRLVRIASLGERLAHTAARARASFEGRCAAASGRGGGLRKRRSAATAGGR
jgi:hypothetical protein